MLSRPCRMSGLRRTPLAMQRKLHLSIPVRKRAQSDTSLDLFAPATASERAKAEAEEAAEAAIAPPHIVARRKLFDLSERQQHVAVTKNRRALREDVRLARFEEMFDWMRERTGRTRGRPEGEWAKGTVGPRNWVRLIERAGSVEELARVTRLFGPAEERGGGVDERVMEVFVERCASLHAAPLALAVYGDPGRYPVPLTMSGALTILHSLSSSSGYASAPSLSAATPVPDATKHNLRAPASPLPTPNLLARAQTPYKPRTALSHVLTFSALWAQRGLPPVAQNPLATSIVLQTLLRVEARKPEDKAARDALADALVRDLKAMVADGRLRVAGARASVYPSESEMGVRALRTGAKTSRAGVESVFLTLDGADKRGTGLGANRPASGSGTRIPRSRTDRWLDVALHRVRAALVKLGKDASWLDGAPVFVPDATRSSEVRAFKAPRWEVVVDGMGASQASMLAAAPS